MANRTTHAADSITVGLIAGTIAAFTISAEAGAGIAVGCAGLGVLITPDLDLVENRHGCVVEALSVVLYLLVVGGILWMIAR